MTYEVMTDKEEQEKKFKLWDDGEYDFTFLEEVTFGTIIIKAEEKLSSAQNPMWVIPVKVYAKDGTDFTTTVIDRMMLTGGMRFKHKHAAEAVGLKDKYEKKLLSLSDLIGKSGKCLLEKIPENTDQKTGKVYKAKNGIADYIPKDAKASDSDNDLNDELPELWG